MTTLRVQFPVTQWPGWHIPELTLTSTDQTSLLPSSSSAITVQVDPKTDSDYCSDSPVFRAYIKDTLQRQDGTQVVLKFAFREDFVDDLAQEAEVYRNALEPLQGSAIPRCYGLFTGEGEEGQEIACLVLEYCGESLDQPFCLLPLDVRMRILERLYELHKCGVHHGDFAERNVLKYNNDIRLIDFDQTEFHDCDCNQTFDVRPGAKLPRPEDFGCPALWEICRFEMRIWDESCDFQEVFYNRKASKIMTSTSIPISVA
ncbi:hypothetical protein VNI00_000312 [Paramarasmius palmivorus]|uniref:Non-specific serine/threonine protein kinase n=1 Tax=Paramarasmius palmivorus TaxID=297713 RepID=A0AAW0EC93_9AGAR